jgi:hypothetical protein
MTSHPMPEILSVTIQDSREATVERDLLEKKKELRHARSWGGI